MNLKPFKESEDFLTAEEVSKYLRIPRSTIYRLSQIGKIKAIKIGRHWRYIKSEIEQCISLEKDFSGEPARKPAPFIERRAYPRINSNFKCQYSINLPPFKEISSEGIVKNLSAGGILLVNVDERINEININDPIEIQFVLILDNSQKIDIKTRGRVVRKTQDAIGIKFKNINKEIQNRIIEYVG